ncbi:cytochrome B5 isoform D, ARABIDOPSIS CYTOCHROME B5 ISOFORM D [Hibiscus trionum]|uniref:Cytochrome B5 isoform D, ARABIDOPSIS CYTOCHROME B5 ISOFORM D n=1 Tax=Hibiscus trionum TaxID=183268 RepID=A0A9W7M6E1_HIBTR|nr:cytochrome B5 isoform D, ARABIDOPSIS CYTOCHROME B5 ISOFORM D [Hibiscus trionum]
MAEHTVFTLPQVAQHKSKNDCWLVIHGRVLNVTKFLEEHPGGEDVLLESAGKDASKEFNDIGHSKTAKNLVFKYQVGVVQGYTSNNNEYVQVAATEEPIKRETSAFVIRDERRPKYDGLLEFIVPLLAAASYFCYRYLTRSS